MSIDEKLEDAIKDPFLKKRFLPPETYAPKDIPKVRDYEPPSKQDRPYYNVFRKKHRPKTDNNY